MRHGRPAHDGNSSRFAARVAAVFFFGIAAHVVFRHSATIFV